jgi:hypothetical protein
MFSAKLSLQRPECASCNRALFCEPRGQMFVPFVRVGKLAIGGLHVYDPRRGRLVE